MFLLGLRSIKQTLATASCCAWLAGWLSVLVALRLDERVAERVMAACWRTLDVVLWVLSNFPQLMHQCQFHDVIAKVLNLDNRLQW